MVIRGVLRDALDALEPRIEALESNVGSARNEFHLIDPSVPSEPCYSATLPQNQGKNRYTDVLPYERTRVRLTTSARGDYINASLICSDEREAPAWGYISAQGPLEGTAEEHWRMVLENQVPAIVMLTRFKEGNRVKSFPYFPDQEGQTVTFGPIQVECKVRQEPEPELTLRILHVSDTKTGQEGTVHHFMFLGWPDHGVPTSSRTIRRLCEIVQDGFRSRYAPLVHCSAGIGRTGTFIVLDVMIRRLRHLLMDLLPTDESEVAQAVDIQGLVKHLRRQRPGMVQTEEQYQFCYHALIDHIQELLAKDDPTA